MSRTAIYRSPAGEAAILAHYDKFQADLGLSLAERMVDTRFGPTHVLVSGPENAPPVVITHGGNSINPQALHGILPLLKEKTPCFQAGRW